MKFRSLATLYFILLLVSACSGQPARSTALPAQAPAAPSPQPTNAPPPTITPRPARTSTDTPVPLMATPTLPLPNEEMDREATATMQTLIASLPRTATVIARLNQATDPARVIPEDWMAVRAVLPPDILVYMPTFVPERFGAPEVYDVKVNEPLLPGPVYTVGYWKPAENGDPNTVVFILNNGQGSWGAEWTGPGFTRKPITVDGESGEFYSIPGENSSPSLKGQTFYRASWKKQGQYYQIKAISSRMTEAEFMQIVQSVIPLKK